MIELSSKKIASRKNPVFYLARAVFSIGTRHLATPHVEMHEYIKELKKDNHAVFLYTGLHKSLWETTGVLISLHRAKLPIPYTGMGDNLVKGKFFQDLSKKTGLFFIKRAKTRREIIESAKMLKDYVLNLIAHGVDVLFYPEGTRKNIPHKRKYGNFFPTAFEALLEYEKNKEELIEANKDLPGCDSYVIPFNVDYSKVREDWEMIEENEGKPRTLHIFDTLKMIKNVGDVFISLGEPIKISENLDKNRKQVAEYTRQKCLDLVKILPINIVSRSILDSHHEGKIHVEEISRNISKNIERLKHLEDRFRMFTANDEPQALMEIVAKADTHFRQIEERNIPLYRLYSDYINHYFEKNRH